MTQTAEDQPPATGTVGVQKYFSALFAGPSLAYGILFILGVGVLLPWYMLVNAVGYYIQRFCPRSYQYTFNSFFSVCCNGAQPVGLLFTIYFKKELSIRTLVHYPLVTYSIFFLLTTLMVVFPSVFFGDVLFVITLILAIIFGACNSIMNSGLFGLAGILPPQYTSAVMGGTGMAGALVSLISIITTVSNESTATCDTGASFACSYSLDKGALAYFIIATTILTWCLWLFHVLMKLDFVKEHMKKHKDLQDSQELNEDEKNSPTPAYLPLESDKTEAALDNPSSESIDPNSMALTVDGTRNIELAELGGASVSESPSSKQPSSFWDIVWAIKWPAFAVYVIFTTHICVTPTIISITRSTEYCESSQRIYNDLWVPVVFFIVNTGDYVGRVWAEMLKDHYLFSNADYLIIPAFLRVVIHVLFLFTNIQNSRLPMFLDHDAAPILLGVALGLSTGFFSNLVMMKAPQMVKPQDASMAATIMVFCLSSGLFSGSLVGFLNQYIITGSAV